MRENNLIKAIDFLAAVIDHAPPKSQHTVRYYGIYSNKTRSRVQAMLR
ncbi:MAG: transposase [Akkermansiaceae bacterium]|nr:transposase [Akkermansiaceae bacterium]